MIAPRSRLVGLLTNFVVYELDQKNFRFGVNSERIDEGGIGAMDLVV